MTQRGAMGGPPVQPDGMSPSGVRSPSSRPADSRRLELPERIGPQPGETQAEARERNRANLQRHSEWVKAWSERCARCDLVRGNVAHEMDPTTAPEGAEYYQGWEQHPFEPSGTWHG